MGRSILTMAGGWKSLTVALGYVHSSDLFKLKSASLIFPIEPSTSNCFKQVATSGTKGSQERRGDNAGSVTVINIAFGAGTIIHQGTNITINPVSNVSSTSVKKREISTISSSQNSASSAVNVVNSSAVTDHTIHSNDTSNSLRNDDPAQFESFTLSGLSDFSFGGDDGAAPIEEPIIVKKENWFKRLIKGSLK